MSNNLGQSLGGVTISL